MLGSREEAEDVVQQVFAAAYQALLADERDIALKAWLYAIARNRCLSVLRVRREHVELDDDAAQFPATAGLSAEVEQREDLRALLDDLQRLPDEQRAALVLAELGAHSHEEIAVVLGVPTAKIKALIFQAREALMIRRLAREADCGPIREQLAVLRGGSRRRRELRHHVAQCDGCRAFEAEVRRQRAGLAVLLPVAPTLALKESSLAAAFAASGGGAAAAGGAAAGGAAAGSATAGTMAAGGATAGGAAAGGAAAVGGAAGGAGGSGLLTGGGALLGKAIGAKAVIAALAVTGVAGGGYATVEQISSHRANDQAVHAGRGPDQNQKQNQGAKPPVGVPVLPPTHGICPKDRVRTAAGCELPSSHDLLPASRPAGFPDRQAASGDGGTNGADTCTTPAGPGAGCPKPASGNPSPGQASGTPTPATVPTRGDRDGDGVPNRQDGCPTQAGTVSGCPASATGQAPAAHPKPGDRDGDGIPNSEDADRDGDGIPNRLDPCPNIYAPDGGCPKPAPGEPTPAGPAAGDRDGDGFANRVDNCPNIPGPVGGCPEQPAPPASQPGTPPPAPAPGDRDGDGIPNNADQDRDNDGLINREDNCPNKAGPIGGCPVQVASDPPPDPANDRDGDGIADNVDVDRDNDGFFNIADNCPNKPGPVGGCPEPAPPAPPPPPPAPPPPPSPPPADTTTTTTP
jgi:RNA polymerase sigma factor (sigma-70 family)